MRYRPNLDRNTFVGITEVVDQVDSETGEVVAQNFFPGREKLPPCELFDLSAMVKAGVSLQKTNPKILGSSVREIADVFNDIADDISLSKPSNNGENHE